MIEPLIREARTGDAPSLADTFREWGREYAAMDAEAYRVPDAEGLGYARTTIGFSKRM